MRILLSLIILQLWGAVCAASDINKMTAGRKEIEVPDFSLIKAETRKIQVDFHPPCKLSDGRMVDKTDADYSLCHHGMGGEIQNLQPGAKLGHPEGR